jgi:modification methylase
MFSFWGDTVLDPFCGTGTTMVAAMKSNRSSIGLEIASSYCRLAANRLRDENQNLFSSAQLQFLKLERTPAQGLILHDAEAIYSKAKTAKQAHRSQNRRHAGKS